MLDYLLKFDPYEAGFEAGWGALYEPPPMTDAKSSMLTAAYTPLAMLAEALESPGQAGGDRAAIEEIKTNLKHWPALGDEMVSVPRQVYTDLRKAVVMSSDTHKTSKTDAMNKIDKLCTGAPSAKFVVKELKNGNVESWVSVFTQETIIRRLEKQNTINEDQAKYMLDYLRAMKG